MNTSAPIHTGSSLDRLSRLDHRLRQWSLEKGAREFAFPTLIDRPTLQLAGYPDAFPHLLLGACCATDPGRLFADDNTELTGWCLSPAVCYHAYACLAGQVLEAGRIMAARGACFRNEEAEELQPGRRQIEFQMRELILLGTPDWIDEQLAGVESEIDSLAAGFGLRGEWSPASDPFFLPAARAKARMQQLLGTKRELCLEDGLAIASTNRHRDFFGRRFDITLPDRSPAHSACVAFGLDRWQAHSTTSL